MKKKEKLKNSEEVIKELRISAVSGRIKFERLSDYYSYISDFAPHKHEYVLKVKESWNILNYSLDVNTRKVVIAKNQNLEDLEDEDIEDEIMPFELFSILNEEGTFQVAEWIYTMDFKNGTVHCKRNGAKEVNTYSFSESVILLTQGSEAQKIHFNLPPTQAAKHWNPPHWIHHHWHPCFELPHIWVRVHKTTYFFDYSPTGQMATIKLRCKLVYRSLGILHAAWTKGHYKYYDSVANSWADWPPFYNKLYICGIGPIGLNVNQGFYKRCCLASVPLGYISTATSSNPSVILNSIYTGIIALHSFNIQSEFYILNIGATGPSGQVSGYYTPLCTLGIS